MTPRVVDITSIRTIIRIATSHIVLRPQLCHIRQPLLHLIWTHQNQLTLPGKIKTNPIREVEVKIPNIKEVGVNILRTREAGATTGTGHHTTEMITMTPSTRVL